MGYTESYACGVQIRPHSEARETKAGITEESCVPKKHTALAVMSITIRKFTTFAFIILMCCIVFVSCDRTQKILAPVVDGYRHPVVSLVPTTTALAVGDQVKIEIRITGGKGVAGYAPRIIFDSDTLKYISASGGDYFPTGGVWMHPHLSDNGDYIVILRIGETTTWGKSVIFGPMSDPPIFSPGSSIDHIFYRLPLLTEDLAVPNTEAIPPNELSEAYYRDSAIARLAGSPWSISLLAGSPLGANTKPIPVDGDGILATVTFEVIDAKPAYIQLVAVNLFDTNDDPLTAPLPNEVVTVKPSCPSLGNGDTLPNDVVTDTCRGGNWTAPLPSGPLSGEITIGVVLSQTGNYGQTDFGPGALVMQNSFELARQAINQSQLLGDATLKFIIEDDMSTRAGAVVAFNKLINQSRVPVILGVWTSHIAQSVFPIAQENGVVAFSPVVTASGLAEIGDFIFRTSLSSDVLIRQGIGVTHTRLGYDRVATIGDTVDFASVVSSKVYKQTLADYGVSVLTNETFITGDTDFSEQLARIKALSPDAIFVSAQDIELIRILTQARALGISNDIPFITLILSQDLIQSAGAAAEGTITFSGWVQTADTLGNRSFVDTYAATYGMPPSFWAAQSYAAVYILAEAIKTAQSTDAAAIAGALAQINDVETILGQFSFDAHGNGMYDPVVLIVKNGTLEVF